MLDLNIILKSCFYYSLGRFCSFTFCTNLNAIRVSHSMFKQELRLFEFTGSYAGKVRKAGRPSLTHVWKHVSLPFREQVFPCVSLNWTTVQKAPQSPWHQRSEAVLQGIAATSGISVSLKIIFLTENGGVRSSRGQSLTMETTT